MLKTVAPERSKIRPQERQQAMRRLKEKSVQLVYRGIDPLPILDEAIESLRQAEQDCELALVWAAKNRCLREIAAERGVSYRYACDVVRRAEWAA